MTVFIGPHRNDHLLWTAEQIGNSNKHVFIPDFHTSPELTEIAIKQFRQIQGSGIEVTVSTDCAMFLDHCMPEEIFTCDESDRSKCMRDNNEFVKSLAVGIQHVSEILRTQGLWR